MKATMTAVTPGPPAPATTLLLTVMWEVGFSKPSGSLSECGNLGKLYGFDLPRFPHYLYPPQPHLLSLLIISRNLSTHIHKIFLKGVPLLQ